jgi:competence protein ComEC
VRQLRGIVRDEPLPGRPLVVVAGCMAAGCAAPRLVAGGSGVGLAVAAWGGAVLALVLWAWCARVGRPMAAAGGLVASIALAAAAWSVARFDLFPVDDLAWRLADTPVPVAVRGRVVESFRALPPPADEPARRAVLGPSSECLLAVEAVRVGSRWRAASGQAAVIVDGEPPPLVQAGARIRVLGRGLRPWPALNPGEFDERLRARSRRCLSIVRVRSAAAIRLLASPAAWRPVAVLDAVRGWGAGVLRAHVATDRAGLAAALLLGSRESIAREEVDDFLVTGTVHVLSISGLHVGLLAIGLFAVCRAAAVPRGWALAVVAACTGAYMLLVQAETPVVRATLWVWIGCLAAAAGRRSSAINGLAAAAIIVLAWRPADVFSVGTQLSFLSTAVLVGAAAALPRARPPTDPIDRLIERSRPPVVRRLRRAGAHLGFAFLSGAAVWAATAPLVAARFHLLSPVALVLNVLVAPLVAAAMGAGFLCLVAAALVPPLAAPCGAACDAALAATGWLVARAADLPGGHFWVPGPPAWWVAGWYALLFAAVVGLAAAMRRRPATWLAVAATWAAVGWVGVAVARIVAPPRAEVRVIAAALGHGCGIVVRSPLGRCLVYDAGRLGAASAARRGISAVLWSEGIRRIDTLVISHADADHMNAVPELCARFEVAELAVGAAFLDNDAPTARDVVAAARAHGIPLRVLAAGDSFAVDPVCRARVLQAETPPHGAAWSAARDSDNESSVVLAIEAAGRRLLLTGDVEGAAADRLVAAGPGACDVLVAPHHGTRTSLPPDVARATAPEWVLVSGAGGPSWPLVRTAYEAVGGGRPAAVIKTGGEGAIAVSLTATAVTAQRFSGGVWRPICPWTKPSLAFVHLADRWKRRGFPRSAVVASCSGRLVPQSAIDPPPARLPPPPGLVASAPPRPR